MHPTQLSCFCILLALCGAATVAQAGNSDNCGSSEQFCSYPAPAACTNTQTDNRNCGGCEAKPTNPPDDKYNCASSRYQGATGGGVVVSCKGGQCLQTCPEKGYSLCGSGRSAHCAATQSDPMNCGSGCVSCTQPTDASTGYNVGSNIGEAVCKKGTCGVTCVNPYKNCAGTQCTDTKSDYYNCGGCGIQCSTFGDGNAQAACVNGKCKITCPYSYAPNQCFTPPPKGQNPTGSSCGTTCMAG